MGSFDGEGHVHPVVPDVDLEGLDAVVEVARGDAGQGVGEARLPEATRRDLAAYLEIARYPLAVRSSSILEDSVYQPFAGVYATIMLPNNHPSLDVRLAQLLEAHPEGDFGVAYLMRRFEE